MTYRRSHSEEEQTLGLGERLLMAVLAPVMFNLSLLIVMSTVLKHSRGISKTLFYPAAYSSPSLIGFLLIGLPALAGFWLGVDRCAILLGHFFYTNMEHEKSPLKTALAWGTLFLISYLLSKRF